MGKEVLKLNNEPCDDDFDLALQEFLGELDNPLDPLDENNDSDTEHETDSCAAKEDNGAGAKLMQQVETQQNNTKEIPEVTIGVEPGYNRLYYTSGDVNLALTVDSDRKFSTNSFAVQIYGEGFFPMIHSQSDVTVDCSLNGLFACQAHSFRVWLPGNYTLLLRDRSDDSLIRVPFRLSKQLKATVGKPVRILPCSIEEMVAEVDKDSQTWNTLALHPGTAQLRLYVLKDKQMEAYNAFRTCLSGSAFPVCKNLLITTFNADFDRSILTSLLHYVASSYYLRYIDCNYLYDASRNNPYEQLFEELSEDGQQVFCLTNIGALLGTGGRVIVKKVMEKIRSNPAEHRLWMLGSRHEVSGLLGMYPALSEFFPKANRLEQEPYTPAEMVEAFFAQINGEGFDYTAGFMATLSKTILKGCQNGTLSAWSVSDIRRFVSEEVRPRYLKRAYTDIMSAQLTYLQTEDIDLGRLCNAGSAYETCISELNAMVGLEEVKQGIITMANNTRFYLERSRRGLPTSQKVAYHCIFTGNPGTGKTTVAHMLGRIYRSLGLLSKGEVISADRTRLVGRYIGETEENMKAILEEARGNVLFIDEAYNLYDGSGDRKDFGARVIDSLLTVLSQPNPDMLIVFAGYLKEMDALLATNPGLAGRFPYKYQFKDYTEEQLFEIARRLFARDSYLLTPEAETTLKEQIAQAYKTRNANFSNARWVEQLVNNGIIPAMANRVAQTACNDYQHVEAADIRKAFEQFNTKAIELKPRQKVGFSA